MEAEYIHRRLSRRAYIVIALVLSMAVLRGFGFITLHWTHSKWEDDSEIELYSEYKTKEHGVENLTKNDETNSLLITSNDSDWSIGFTTKMKDGLFHDLEDQITERIRKDGRVDIQIEEIRLEGPYWLPLFKSGSCTYSFVVSGSGNRQSGFRGNVRGKVDFSLIGLSSTGDVKQKLSKHLSENLINGVLSTAKKWDH